MIQSKCFRKRSGQDFELTFSATDKDCLLLEQEIARTLHYIVVNFDTPEKEATKAKLVGPSVYPMEG